MSFDRDALSRVIASHGRVARVVVADIKGSAPRDPGASMLIWAEGQSGTIGGGALELEAATTARAMLMSGGTRLTRRALGPELGQCCGGAVTLATEVFDAAALAATGDGPYVRRLDGSADMPLSMAQALRMSRGQGIPPKTQLDRGWFIEAAAQPERKIWLFGAGHVGRALVEVLAPFPDVAITWIDTDRARFPESPPVGVTILPTDQPAALLTYAPPEAEVLILTYSHALDLELCHSALTHGIARIGLIGSATKWARFRSRLGQLGHSQAAIARIACPIGDPALGKHPQAIAVGVAAALLRSRGSEFAEKRDETG